MIDQQQAERHFEYRPQRKVMRLAGILMMIMPIVGVPMLLYGEVQPVTLLGFDLNTTWSAIFHIGMGILCFISGVLFILNGLRIGKSGTYIQFTSDNIIFPDIKTGNNANRIRYMDISEVLIEDKGKRKLLRLTHSKGKSILDSADMESLAAFEKMNEVLQKYLSSE